MASFFEWHQLIIGKVFHLALILLAGLEYLQTEDALLNSEACAAGQNIYVVSCSHLVLSRSYCLITNSLTELKEMLWPWDAHGQTHAVLDYCALYSRSCLDRYAFLHQSFILRIWVSRTTF